MAIEHDLLERYRDPNLAEKPKQLEERGGAFYSEAAVQLIASLHAGTGDVQVVDVRNAGALPGIADDEVVEVPARITADGAIPLRQAPLHPEMLDLILRVKAYERLTIRAALSGSRELALEALSGQSARAGRRGRAAPRCVARGESGPAAAVLPGELANGPIHLRRLEDIETALAAALGHVHRDICLADKL